MERKCDSLSARLTLRTLYLNLKRLRLMAALTAASLLVLLASCSTPAAPEPSITTQGTLNCFDEWIIKTGTFIDRDTVFECRYRTDNFDIYYNPKVIRGRFPRCPGGVVLPGVACNPDTRPNHPSKTDLFVISSNLAPELESAYARFSSRSWSLKDPKSVYGIRRFTIAVGGASIPADGFSRQSVIQFKPKADDGGTSADTFSRGFVRHELFHQYQWAYTDDDLGSRFDEGFFESMADYAAGRSCTSRCKEALANPFQKPWDPSYHGEPFFEYLEKVRRNKTFLHDLLTAYDRNGDDDVRAVNAVFGSTIIHNFRRDSITGSRYRADAEKMFARGGRGIVVNLPSKYSATLTMAGEEAYMYRIQHSRGDTIKITFNASVMNGAALLSFLPCNSNSSSVNYLNDTKTYTYTYKVNDCGSSEMVLSRRLSRQGQVRGLLTIERLSSSPPPPSCTRSWPVIERNSGFSNKAKAVQYLLKAKGYSLTVDGYFGPGTEAVVKSFQRSQGLRDDGEVGQNTFERLVVFVKQGNKGDAVKAAQLLLAGVTVDGDFGPKTDAAVKSFQRSKNLVQDGKVGANTWAALFGGRGCR